MPSGEVFTGPHEDSAEGHIRFTIPTSPRGVVVEDVTLEFREGRVVSARAERGDGYLQATLETDDGARILGELGIGTNFGIDRPIGAILFDEKIGGTVHLALGKSYPETGGTNESVVHWDLICDLRQGGRLSADGDTILRGRAIPRREMRRFALLVVVLLAGCGGSQPSARLRQVDAVPALRADDDRADAVAGAGERRRRVHGVLRRRRARAQLRLRRPPGAAAPPPPAGRVPVGVARRHRLPRRRPRRGRPPRTIWPARRGCRSTG